MIFSGIEDPRGYKISCTKEQWHDHILKGHPNMVGFEKEVIKTIQHPDLPIFQDADYNNRNIYYSIHRKIHGQNYYIKAIVKIDQAKSEGYLITAFKTFNTKPGERMI